MKDIVKRLEIKAGVMEMGERIQWGSDTALMREAAAHIATLTAELAEARAEVERLRDECERMREENKRLTALAYPVIRDPVARMSDYGSDGAALSASGREE